MGFLDELQITCLRSFFAPTPLGESGANQLTDSDPQLLITVMRAHRAPYRLFSEFRSDCRRLVSCSLLVSKQHRTGDRLPLMTATLMLGLGRVGSIPPVRAYNPNPGIECSVTRNCQEDLSRGYCGVVQFWKAGSWPGIKASHFDEPQTRRDE
jgi:hypothetical protein